jgi:hypothetical protein
MLTRLALIFSVVAVGLALNGCTRCGSIWTIRRNRRSLAPKPCAEVLQVGPSLVRKLATLGVEAGAVVYRWENAGSVP